MLQRLKSSKQRKRNTQPATQNINKTTTKQGASSDDHTKAKVAAHNKRVGTTINSKITNQSKETSLQVNVVTDNKLQRTAVGNKKTTIERSETNPRIKATQVEDYQNCDERRALPQVQKNKPVNKKQELFPIFGHAGCVLCILQVTVLYALIKVNTCKCIISLFCLKLAWNPQKFMHLRTHNKSRFNWHKIPMKKRSMSR